MSDQPVNRMDLDDAFAKYLRLLDEYGTIDVDKFLQEHSEIANELRDLIETARHIKNMAGPKSLIPGKSQPEVDESIQETLIFSGDSLSLSQDATDAEYSVIGKQLGDYQILQELGRGGMGVVYLAEQVSMGRKVALKMIRSGCLATESDIQRFYFEAQAAGRLKHSSIVQVYQVGQIDGHHFFAMELIEGYNLSTMIREQQLTAIQTASIMQRIADAIDFAHQHGVLHRDLKPSNIMIGKDGHPRITDFGLAKELGSGDHLSDSGSAVGTPSYMSPEQAQARRDELTCRSDVYSLGAILYQMITGNPPFVCDSLLQTLTMVTHEEPRPPRDLNEGCPRALDAICLKCLQKSPSDRYETANQLSEDLQRFLRGDRVHANQSWFYRRIWLWLRNVPLIAAVIGRKSTNPTLWHTRFQWTVVTMVIAFLIGVIAIPSAVELARVTTIDISTGAQSGSYTRIGESLAKDLRGLIGQEVVTHSAIGAVESHRRLLSGHADIAFLQENTLVSDELKVLTPLYREVVLTIVRSETTVKNIADLSSIRISLGQPGSGMRQNSDHILSYFHINILQSPHLDQPYTDLLTDDSLQGAIITTKLDDEPLLEILETKKFRLVSYPDMSDIPGLRAFWLRTTDFPAGIVPEEGMFAPATFAILAVRAEMPNRLVRKSLESIYQETGLSSQFPDVFTLREASAWTDLNYHSEAHKYFSDAREDFLSPASTAKVVSGNP